MLSKREFPVTSLTRHVACLRRQPACNEPRGDAVPLTVGVCLCAGRSANFEQREGLMLDWVASEQLGERADVLEVDRVSWAVHRVPLAVGLDRPAPLLRGTRQRPPVH